MIYLDCEKEIINLCNKKNELNNRIQRIMRLKNVSRENVDEIILAKFDKIREEFKQKLDYYLNNIASLLDCPFCGFKPNPADDDCIYPISSTSNVWQLVCYATNGGCDATILGDNPIDCIHKWNTRWYNSK